MGAIPAKCHGDTGGAGSKHDGSFEDSDSTPIMDKDDNKKHSSGERVHCPTCQGTGRIPRDQENDLVALIPCNDQRLKSRHTKLYVSVSIGVCLLVSSLVLFFLFPRSVLLSPVAVKSSSVIFTENDVRINVTNVLNITNNNFVAVHAYNLTVQALYFNTVVGTVSIKNISSVEPLSIIMHSFEIPIRLTEEDPCASCKNPLLPVRMLCLNLQMSMTVYYLAHYEQISLETHEYINCGANSTIPHIMQPPTT